MATVPRLRTLLVLASSAALLRCDPTSAPEENGGPAKPDPETPPKAVITKVWSDLPGDFAPLSPVNVWKYRMVDSSLIDPGAGKAVKFRIWRVASATFDSTTGDSVFVLTWKDSLEVGGQTSDPPEVTWVHTRGNQVFIVRVNFPNASCFPLSPMHIHDTSTMRLLKEAFIPGIQNARLDSAVLGADTLRLLKTRWEYGSMGNFSSSNRILAEGLGLLEVRERSSGIHGINSGSTCVLEEFNGTRIPPLADEFR